MSLAVVHARVLGPRKARTPSGHPIHIHTPVFDDGATSPQAAIAKRARQLFGIEVHEAHWNVVAIYDVIDGIAITVKEKGKPRLRCPAAFDVLYVMRYEHEAAMRTHLGISDDVLDPFEQYPSWYLEKRP